MIEEDPFLTDYQNKISVRQSLFHNRLETIEESCGSLLDFANGYLFFGTHKTDKGFVFREWAPNAKEIFLIGDHCSWKPNTDFAFTQKDDYWELFVDDTVLHHGSLYRLLIRWDGGEGERIPAWVTRVVQDEGTKIFSAQIWNPSKPYMWEHPVKREEVNFKPIIYEAHVGMAQESPRVGTYKEFTEKILPKIAAGGYNTLQLMAVQEHPYYGSFGYHVSSFFAASSRFGTPEDLKNLVDNAHELGLKVIMDLIHSHAVKNEVEGLAKYDGTEYQFFHKGDRGNHPAWDSKCFDYAKQEVVHFLLSNCKYWLEEYNFDGFRIDGVTSMLYTHHGLERDFSSYEQYFDDTVDVDAEVYLMLLNRLVHDEHPSNITVAEEMSGMPGIAMPIECGGFGFNHRLAMGVPDYWIKIVKTLRDEDWDVGNMYYELTNRRAGEGAISYLESHDQAIVGDKTMIFRLIDKEMYTSMSISSKSLAVDRGIALHKMLRLMTISTAGSGYLNFMGNEFGHPEWIDFPRAGNDWSYKYCRRQWSLQDNKTLRYYMLSDFDKDMISLIKDHGCFDEAFPYKVYDNYGDKVIAYFRNKLLFVFNFHPSKSYTDYTFDVPAGKYRTLLDTDWIEYDGFGRIDREISHFTINKGKQNLLSLYLPCRVALVLYCG